MNGAVPLHSALLVTAAWFLLLQAALGRVTLTHLSSVYVPAAKARAVAYDEQAVEQIAYDPVRKLIYTAGKEVHHVINANDPANLVIEQTEYVTNADFTDIEICGDRVFLTKIDRTDLSKGSLRVYRRFERGSSDSLKLLLETEVGPGPDCLSILDNCQTVVVAVEGEAYLNNGVLQNPKGQVVIVQLKEDSGTITATSSSLNFDSFNSRYSELKPAGVRYVYSENGNQFSQDLEPEYLAVDENAKKAYVILQENNAVAEVDLNTRSITNIRGLGYKQWGSLDASDRDAGLRITYWPIRSWYSPDGAKFHEWHGRKLLFTANEGDGKDYPTTPPFDEIVRGKEIPASELGPEISQMLKSALSDDALLGRLGFSKADGKDGTGKYTALYAYGGRSFSIWDLTSAGTNVSRALPLVFDSGSQLEEMTALHCPHLFNRDEDSVDDRSDDKGPEPESIAVGEIDSRLYIFIGLERPGTIAVYSLGRDFTRARFETIFCEGIPDNSKTMAQKFAAREVYALDPEDLRFYSASQSPTGRPVVMVAGTISSTVTLLEVKVTDDDNNEPQYEILNPNCPSNSVLQVASLVLLCLCLALHRL